ncbi:MAG TPA: hypothetical protein VF607_01855, partial [Verrucomicrobiae bacterium]
MMAGGKYVLGNTGNAGVDMVGNSLTLGLIAGGWNVAAGNNINLQEVRNPNGMFNTVGSSSVKHLFNYAPTDYVNLTAGNGVLLGETTSTAFRVDSFTIPQIYPSILSIMAGAGGLGFLCDATYRQMVLYASPYGGLTINTTDGGGIYNRTLNGAIPTSGTSPLLFSLIVSDSPDRQYLNNTSFLGTDGTGDHGATPVHLNSEQPVTLNISGDVNRFTLISSEAATVNVGGNLKNSRFQGMNLRSTDVTTINVTGDINDRSAFTSIDISTINGAAAPDLSVLGRSQDSVLTPGVLLASLYYDSTTHLFTYQNIQAGNLTLSQILTKLQHLVVQSVDAHGNLLYNADGSPVTEVVSVLNATTANALLAASNAQGGLPNDTSGLAIGGGGTFKVSARNINFGNTAGIVSKGAGLYNVNGYYPLAALFTTGPKIVVDASGNIDMLASTISSLNGGDIYVNADGYINVGSSQFTVNTTGARGIFSTGQGNVAVYAGGDINLNGSRIAVYDTRPAQSGVPTPGGSLTVVSRNGDVIVGGGGSGSVV